jgi:hypothetical protein
VATTSHGKNATSDENNLRNLPRGFFADQFEVRYSISVTGQALSLSMLAVMCATRDSKHSRIGVIIMLISMVLAQRSGVRPMLGSMRLYQVQVCCPCHNIPGDLIFVSWHRDWRYHCRNGAIHEDDE